MPFDPRALVKAWQRDLSVKLHAIGPLDLDELARRGYRKAIEDCAVMAEYDAKEYSFGAVVGPQRACEVLAARMRAIGEGDV